MIRKAIVFSLLFLIILSGAWSLIDSRSFPLHDFTHAARFVVMAKGLREGQLPVRWSQDFGYGFGMPLYQFYAPLPYYIGGLLHLIGLNAFTALKILYILITILTAIGGYKLGSFFWGSSGGILTAAALTLAPYRALNLFIRGALSETVAIMSLVWIFYTMSVFWKFKTKANWLKIVFWTSVLLLSHNVVTLLSLPYIVLLSLVFAATELRQIKESLTLALTYATALALSVGLSAFYLFPSFFEKDFTRVAEQVITDYFNYKLHFLYLRQLITPGWGYGGSQWGPDDPISFFLGFGNLFAMIMSIVLLLMQIKKLLKEKKPFLSQMTVLYGILIICFLSSILFTTEKSLIVWNSFPVMQFIQFPWRFLSISIIFLALLAGGSMLFLRPVAKTVWFSTLFVLLCANAWYFRPERYLDSREALYYQDLKRIRTEMSGILPDYIPKQMDVHKLALQPNGDQVFTCQNFASCEMRHEVLIDKDHEKLVSVDLPGDELISWAIAYFPGWVVEIDGQPVTAQMSSDGLLSVQVPKGSHVLGARFGSTRLRLLSDIVSLASILIVLAVWWQVEHEKS